MRRREFLALCAAAGTAPGQTNEQIMTVTGPLASGEAGTILPHEHVMSIFGGDPVYRVKYDEEKLFETVVPYLKSLGDLGCDMVADCTAAWFGRAPVLLKEISEKTGVRILTNTGYYGAANDKYVPKHAMKETAGAIAGHWVTEWKEGIDGTAIRPGFMKIGVDSGPLSEIDAKLVRAAAIAHGETGLVMAVHTGGNPESASQQLDILKSEGVSPEAWIWVHANKVEDPDDLLRAADSGAWIELDGIAEEAVEDHLKLVALMKEHGHLKRTLLSHDGNSFRYGGRPPKPYGSLFTHFLPALKQAGYTESDFRQLVSANPANAFTIRKRPV